MEIKENGRIEYAVAESFTASDGVEVLCEEDNRRYINCEGCYFIGKETICPLCTKNMRSDKKNVIYKVLYDPSKSEPKTYFEVGEEFQMGLVRLRCEEEEENEEAVRADELCLNCFFRNIHCDSVRGCIGNCFGEDRPDGKDVVFVELK